MPNQTVSGGQHHNTKPNCHLLSCAMPKLPLQLQSASQEKQSMWEQLYHFHTKFLWNQLYLAKTNFGAGQPVVGSAIANQMIATLVHANLSKISDSRQLGTYMYLIEFKGVL